MASGDITVDILARDHASRTFAKVGRSSQQAGGHISKLGGKLKTFAKVGAVAAAAGVAIAGKQLWDMGQKASDLNETISKTNEIFGGKSSKNLQKWAAGAATAMGQSKQQALDAAATFGVFGKAAGKSGGDLAAFAKENSQLASDLASFHNTSPEDAITAIGAAFRGEMEPIRRYGVLLDDAALRQQALKMGLIETTKQALTPQQKTLAAQKLILKQTADAQGDFARTSGGLANQQRILGARFENLKTTIGQAVLPVMLKFVTFLNQKAIPWLEKMMPTFKRIADAAIEFGKMLWQKAGKAIEKVRDWLSQFRGEAEESAEIWRGKFAEAVDAVKQAWADAQPALDTARDWLKTIAPVIRQHVWPWLQKLAEMQFDRMVKGIKIAGKLIGAFGVAARVMWNNYTQPVLSALIRAFAGVVRKIGEVMSAMGRIKGAPKWMKESGDKLQRAADEADDLADNIRKIPRNWSTNYTLTTHYAYTGTPPKTKGGPIDPAGRMAGRAPSGVQRGGGMNVTVNVNGKASRADAEELLRMFRKMKRDEYGGALGLA